MSLTTEKVIQEISSHNKKEKNVLIKDGIISYLKEQKRKIMIDKLELLGRYNVPGSEEIKQNIDA